MRQRIIRGLLALAAAGASLGAAPAKAPRLSLETVSARPDMVSGGDVLVRITGTEITDLRLDADGRDVTSALAPAADGRGMLGLIGGLQPGRNRLTARAGNAAATLTVTDWPIQGPVFSGPRQTPFICQTAAFKLPDGGTLGPSEPPECAAPTRVHWLYKPKGAAALAPLGDLRVAAADVDETLTSEGVRVPFMVRVETGVIDRSIYQFAVLADPSQGAADPRTPPKAWNRRLIALHGTGCTGGWYAQGPALGAEVLDTARLGEGYALFASTLNHPSNSCNAVLAAETTMMVKERVIEALGPPLYTLSKGESGGAYTSLQVADAYPGLIDGVLISSVFPDALSIALTGLDGHLLTHYFQAVAPGRFTAAQQQAVGGFGVAAGLQAHANQAGRADPVADRKDVAGYASGRFSPAVPEALRYHPVSNPKGARPTVFDAAVNIYGRDPATGFARRPFDNVGVQYGLAALNAGAIDKSQFLDLNQAIGGYDADANYVARRTVGDPQAITAAYRSGLLLSGAGGLARLPILDTGGLYTDLEPAGEYHARHYHFAARERIAAANGGTANMVIWGGGVSLAARMATTDTPEAVQGRRQAAEGFRLMQAWMSAIAGDPAPASAAKTARLRPAGLSDGCWAAGPEPRFIAEPQVYPDKGRCGALYPAFKVPRMVAGGPLAGDVLKCVLKPLHRRDYGVAFSPAEWGRLRAIFPAGVCDWARPGVGRGPLVPWRSYGSN